MVMTSRRGSEAKRGSGSRLNRRVAGSDDVLVKVDIRPGHKPRLVGAEIGAGARHFLRVDQASKRPVLDGLVEPTVLRAVVALLDGVLSRRRHPADVEA